MTGPKKGGKYGRRGAKKSSNISDRLEFAEPGEAYALVEKACGDGRFKVKIVLDNKFIKNGELFTAHLRGSMRRQKYKHFVHEGHYVLVQLRDFEKENSMTVDIIKTYSTDAMKQLFNHGEIPTNCGKNVGNISKNDDSNVVFEDESTFVNVKSNTQTMSLDTVEETGNIDEIWEDI